MSEQIENAIREQLESNKLQIVKDAKEAIREGLVQRIKYSTSEVLENTIKKFIEEEIVPEIYKSLMGEKETIIKMCEETCIGIGASITESMTKNIREKLSQSYYIKRIFDTIF